VFVAGAKEKKEKREEKRGNHFTGKAAGLFPLAHDGLMHIRKKRGKGRGLYKKKERREHGTENFFVFFAA